jgi:hypothetical protein
MIKYKVFYTHIDDRLTHDDSIRTFIDELCNVGHTFMTVNTVLYSGSNGHLNRFRTEIIYRENQKRTVIVEKTEKK